ncbi:MAG: hypothetical protein IJU12_01080 [Clostridia bacterium]|nr:hypothetical protein [Clostridia bacterium]
MFINSDALLKKIQEAADSVAERSNGKVVYEEYIALPYHGQIILRFNLLEEHPSIDGLDRYETMARACVADEFLIDFMGSVYQKIGVNYRSLDALFAKCATLYGNEQMPKSRYAELIVQDAEHLLKAIGLPAETAVWEIQPEDELLLFVMGDQHSAMGKFSTPDATVNVFQVPSAMCNGLMAATYYAKRQGISLAHALVMAQERI